MTLTSVTNVTIQYEGLPLYEKKLSVISQQVEAAYGFTLHSLNVCDGVIELFYSFCWKLIFCGLLKLTTLMTLVFIRSIAW